MANHIKYPVIDGKKLCGTCGIMKSVSEYAKARRHYTASCNACRKIYAAAYRQRPEVKIASLVYSRTYRAVPANREKLNAKTRVWRKKPDAKLKRNAARKIWTAKEKLKAVAYKGSQCAVCGYNRCAAALDFHHRDPKQKDVSTAGGIVPHWSFEKNKRELDKCVLLCVRCHRELHAGVIKL